MYLQGGSSNKVGSGGHYKSQNLPQTPPTIPD